MFYIASDVTQNIEKHISLIKDEDTTLLPRYR